MSLQSTSGRPFDLQAKLEDAIIQCSDVPALYDLLNQQAAVAAPSARLQRHLSKLIVDPVPGLTAEVFRVFQHTGCDDAAIQAAAAKYLTLSHYKGDWYDETIRAIGWANELKRDGAKSPLIPAYEELIVEAEATGEHDLLAFCDRYER